MKQKVLCLVFAVLLVSCLSPVTALAAKTEISTITVNGLATPVIGEKPDYDVTAADPAYRLRSGFDSAEVNGVCWSKCAPQDLTATERLFPADNPVFELGYLYIVSITLLPDQGYCFADPNTITGRIDNRIANVSHASSQMDGSIMSISYTFDLTVVDQVDITELTFPKDGSRPDLHVSVNPGLTVQSIRWMDLSTDSYMSETETFKRKDANDQDIIYRLEIVVTAPEGCTFSDDVTCTLCGNPDETQPIPLEYYRINKDGSLTIEYDCDVSEAEEIRSFSDVSTTAFYYDSVAWAVEKGITKGRSETTFAPDEFCKRSEVVTFLHRAKGEPAPTSTQTGFTDVEQGVFYTDPVAWALENDITNGMGDGTFGVNRSCTRSQVVTFLWRAAGCPKPASADHPFTDLEEGAFYYDAVLWAVEKGITNGMTPTTFGPDSTCTRGQIVTFLYRFAG